ncbi:hypothetical protein SAICODRAFT_24108 [Saitoella complicata NRRL Y-17804]|nr:uncharacterized protein SAICODRAFT_24108 [Saitoella complicata NRRL Y-17804]ODQ54295.1 hypothetical protein SAICODRAFT_24108 [Saitoella complicata NRRL Y-17804]
MVVRLIVVVLCGFLNFLGVQGVQSLQNTVYRPITHQNDSTIADVSRLFLSVSGDSKPEVFNLTMSDRPAYQPLATHNMLELNMTMAEDGVMSYPAASCWANIDNSTFQVKGLCEGTVAKVTPFHGRIGVNVSVDDATEFQAILDGYSQDYLDSVTFTTLSDTETYPYLLPLPLEAGLYVLSSNAYEKIGPYDTDYSTMWITVGIVVPMVPRVEVESAQGTNLVINATNLTSEYQYFEAPNTSALKAGWHAMTDATNHAYDRTFWLGNCTLSFWRNDSVLFLPPNKTIANDTWDIPAAPVANFPYWLMMPGLGAGRWADVDEIMAAWDGLGYNDQNATFDRSLAQNLASHIFHVQLSTFNNATFGTSTTLSSRLFQYWLWYEVMESRQQVFLWPYLLVALWMVPMLLYNGWDLFKSRHERYARSVIRDQCLTTEGLIHIYDMYYKKTRTLSPLPQHAKRHSLIRRYDSINTEFSKKGDGVTWDAPLDGAVPYRLAMTTAYQPVPLSMSASYPADPPMPPLPPTYSYSSTHHNQSPPMQSTPAPYLSHDSSPRWPMGFRSQRSHLDGNISEPLLQDDLGSSPDPDPHAIPLGRYGHGH